MRLPLYIALLVMFPACAQTAAPETLTVDQAVAEALQKKLPLVAERANIAIAQARVLTARLRPNPVVSLATDHLDLLGTRFDETNGAGPSEASLRTDFVLERGGKRRVGRPESPGTERMKRTPPTEAVACMIDGGQESIMEILGETLGP